MAIYIVKHLTDFIQIVAVFLATIISKSLLIESLRIVGETFPTKIEVAVGSSFNISCYINPDIFLDKNSSNMYFDDGRNNELFPRDNIIIVNSTTIIYEVHNATEQDTKYRCKCDAGAIMETSVYVGTLPKPVTDFTCQSYYFEYMVCNFTKPINPINTQYNVTFYTTSVKYIYTPDCRGSKAGSMVICNTSFHNYRPRDEFYYYKINAENALGKMEEQHIVVNNWEIIVPPKPDDNLHIEELVDSINVVWRMSKWEDYRPKGLEWEILVKPENFTVLQYQGPDRPDKYGLMHLSLNNLTYPYWPYELKMRARINIQGAIWSEQVIRKFRTLARPPDRPPVLLPGSFYMDSSETSITIYWEQLHIHEHNGYNFSYVVNSIRCNGKSVDLKPIQLKLNSVTYMWNRNSQYEFEVRSHNHKGFSLYASRLIINPLNQINVKLYTPEAIHNIYHANSRTYTLSWKAPKVKENLRNYTVYWCYAKRGLPNECKGSMHFQQLPPDQYNFTTATSLQEHALNLAVSADYSHINTGLHWTECSSDVNSDLVKMDPDVQATSDTTIKVQWSLERVCQSILEGFNLTYCETESKLPFLNERNESEHKCKEPAITKTLPKDWKRYEINNLKPYTNYIITMVMFSNFKKGRLSEPYLIRTLEGTPSPPRQLQVLEVTNTSATIKWQPPSQLNGIIRKYTIILNTDKYEVNSSVLEYKLTNLAGFTAFKVYVLAHTENSSMPSNDVHFTTLIGYPSPPGNAATSSSGIQWTKPQNPRGHVEFYEINVTQMRNTERVRSHISVVMGDTSCIFKQPPCHDHEYKTIIEVRAVNAAPLNTLHIQKIDEIQYLPDADVSDDDDQYNEDLMCKGGRLDEQARQDLKRYHNSSEYHLYKSSWQSTATYACSTSRLSKMISIVLLVIVLSFIMMIALYMARRMYNKMANINCTLPAGLDLYFTKDTTANFNNGNGVDANCSIKAIHNAGIGNLHSKILHSNVSQSVEEQWLVKNQAQEYSCRNEHHYLLASLNQDSNFTDKEHNNCSPLSTTLEALHISDERKEQLQQFQQSQLNYVMTNLNANVENFKQVSRNFLNNNNNSSQSSTKLYKDETFKNSESKDMKIYENKVADSETNVDNRCSTQLINPNWHTFSDDSKNAFPVHKCNSDAYITVQNLNLMPIKSSFNNSILSNGTFSLSLGYNDNTNTNSGYATLDDVTKSALTQEQYSFTSTNELGDLKQATNMNTQNVPISGYVTQQDLNMFAHTQ